MTAGDVPDGTPGDPDSDPVTLRRRLLNAVYGEEAASAVAGQLENLLDRHRRQFGVDAGEGVSAGKAPDSPGFEGGLWDENDVWLIAYADQFTAPDEVPLQTLRSILGSELAYLVNGVHILPFYPWSSDDGFSVMDYTTVDARYGTWDDVTAIAAGQRLMVDAVINHMSAQGPWFQGFLADRAPHNRYFRCEDPETDVSAVVRPRTHPLLTRFDTAAGPRWVWTTFSPDQVDLDYANPEVLLAVVDVVIDYARRGADAIRLDAIGFLWKDRQRSSIHLPETHALIQLLRSCLDEVAPGTILISETNVPHEENISYFSVDPPEVHAVYQFSLAPLLAHAVLTGDTSTLADWAAGIDFGDGVTRTFFNFLAGHDGIGVRPAEGLLDDDGIDQLLQATERAGGRVSYRSLADGGQRPYELNTTWFDLMAVGVDEETAIARHLATHAVLLALPGIAALYVHSLFGSSNDHDGLARTGHNRSLNRARFTVDPSDLGALWGSDDSRATRIRDGLRHHLDARRSSPAFAPSAACSVSAPSPGTLRISRSAGRQSAACLVNLTDRRVDVDGKPLGPYEVVWTV